MDFLFIWLGHNSLPHGACRCLYQVGIRDRSMGVLCLLLMFDTLGDHLLEALLKEGSVGGCMGVLCPLPMFDTLGEHLLDARLLYTSPSPRDLLISLMPIPAL